MMLASTKDADPDAQPERQSECIARKMHLLRARLEELSEAAFDASHSLLGPHFVTRQPDGSSEKKGEPIGFLPILEAEIDSLSRLADAALAELRRLRVA